jgi:hypothetical protein
MEHSLEKLTDVWMIKKFPALYRMWSSLSCRKTPLGRPRHRWEDNIEVHFMEVMKV